MAVLDSSHAVVEYRAGISTAKVLIALRNVSTGDTLDVGAGSCNVLQVINRGVLISETSFVEIAVSWVGTVVTMPGGLANDAADLLLWGSSAG